MAGSGRVGGSEMATALPTKCSCCDKNKLVRITYPVTEAERDDADICFFCDGYELWPKRK